MSQQAQEQPPQQEQQQNWIDKYSSISRIYGYDFVHRPIDYGKSWYDYIKDSNSLIKSTFELTENGTNKYVIKPLAETLEKYDSYVKIVDDLGNTGLDKAESTCQEIKEKSGSLIETFDTKVDHLISYTAGYTPGPVKGATQKCVQAIDTLIEAILPPSKDEDLSQEEKYELEKRMEFLLKLRKRLTTESLKSIPNNSIKTFTSVGTKSISYSMDLLNENLAKVQNLTITNNFNKENIDKLYHMLEVGVEQIIQATVTIKNIGLEPIISLGELAKTIKQTKVSILNAEDNQERLNQFKEGTYRILKSFNDYLNEMVEKGLGKAEYFKKDNKMFNTAIDLFEGTLSKINGVLSNFSKKLDVQPSSPNVSENDEQQQQQQQQQQNNTSKKNKKNARKGKSNQQNNEQDHQDQQDQSSYDQQLNSTNF